ncbi:MAG: glycoside hydrolase family 28 protein [Verrucomicrobiota bacterium]
MKPKFSAWSFLLVFTFALSAAAAMPKFDMPRVQEPKIPKRTVSITDFGAVPDGKTLNTEAFAKAISALADKGGGRVIVPPGLWLTGPIGLKSHVELHLDEGALVVFSPDYSLYPPIQLDMKGRSRTVTTSPIHGENLEDIAITGKGVMDGSGDAWRPVKKYKMTETQWKQLLAKTNSVLDNGNLWWPLREAKEREGKENARPNLLKLVNCRRVLLEDVTFQNSPCWTLNPVLCEDLTLRNVSVRNPWYSQNGDGLDIENCRNVVVRGSCFDVGDDGICLKSGANEEGRRLGVPTENLLIEDCVVYHAHGGVTIGSEMSAGVRNVRVNNCLFLGTDVGLRFKSQRGRGGVVEKIYISNVRMTDIATDAIGFDMYYSNQAPGEGGESAPAEIVPVTEKTPQFRDIYIENVICRGARRAVALQGLPEMPIRGIHLSNVSLTAVNGMACTDAQDITLNHVEILNSHGPVMNLLNSRDVSVDHLTYAPGDGAVIKADGTNNTAVIKHTDLKAGRPDFDLSNGAAAENLKVE